MGDVSARLTAADARTPFWGTIAVTGVTDFEAALLVQSHCSHEVGFILTLVEA
jgi:hypothetical protein